MGLLRFVAAVLFLAAALSGFGWPFEWAIGTDLGLIAAGLLCWVVAGLPFAVPVQRP